MNVQYTALYSCSMQRLIAVKIDNFVVINTLPCRLLAVQKKWFVESDQILLVNIKHLMTGPEGKSEFCFPRISMFPETKSRATFRFEGNKIHCSPRDQSLSDLLYSKIWKPHWDSSHHVQQWSTVNCWPGNSELFPVWRYSFRNVARSWHLAGNSFIVRCHVTLN